MLDKRYVVGVLLFVTMPLQISCTDNSPVEPLEPKGEQVVVEMQPNFPPLTAENMWRDGYGRITYADGKQTVKCPNQDSKTAVLLLIGQSNAANFATKPYYSEHGTAVLNYFDGKCVVAGSPLLGADGVWNEYWTGLGNRLVESGKYDRVILISSAIGGSSIALWEKDGRLNGMLMGVLDDVQSRYEITHILWHQGESDYQTSAEDYKASFASMLESIRKRGVAEPIYVSITSAGREKDLPVKQAQSTLPDISKNICAGVDTDALVELSERNGTGHFGPIAQAKVIDAWFEVLSKPCSTDAIGAPN